MKLESRRMRPRPAPIRLMAILLGAAALIGAAAGTAPGAVEAGAPRVHLVTLANEPITPSTARYFQRALDAAQQDGADALVLQLDTPGGLMDSTHRMVRATLDARVPVIVYVAPAGSRAASAGLFLTMAAHVAAMAPGTRIGAAHPVSIGGAPMPAPTRDDKRPGGPDEQGASAEPTAENLSVSQKKAIEDAAAWIRSLAQLRGRDAEWAVSAVTESRSITAEEAKRQGVIDRVADDLTALLEAVDGQTLELSGRRVTLRTAGARIVPVNMWWGEKLLGVLASPNVAFLLLMLGFYGILFELYVPGWGVSGTLGAICLLLGFFGLAYLPIDYVGLALMALGLGLFVAEAFVTSYGALALGGVLCVVVGGLMLVDTPVQFMRVSATVVIPVALATAVITVWLIGRVIQSARRPPATGDRQLIGEKAVARADFEPGTEGLFCGHVTVHGEHWSAASAQPVTRGRRVRITGREGLSLSVEPAADHDGADASSTA